MNEKKTKKPKKDELLDLEQLLKRVQADFENYRKRAQKEKEEYGKYLNTDLILRLLPVLDNFCLALKHLPKELENDDWVKGIWAIEKQLEQVLSEEGVTAITTEGQQFDPNLHEAIQEVDSDQPENTIVEEISKGYRIGDRVIRPAKVTVAKK